MDYAWKDLDKTGHTSSLITKCFNSLVERYIDFWQDRINNDESCCPNRLQSNKLLKPDYIKEPYIYFIRDRDINTNLAKCNVATIPCLIIESGIYFKLEIVDRICKRCNRVENKTHFLIESSLYTITIQKSYEDACISVDNESKEIIISLMKLKTKDKQLLVNLPNFIIGCFEIRKICQGLY